MIQKAVFRKNYLIFASIALFFIFLAMTFSWVLTSYERDRMFLRPASMNRQLLKTFDEDPKIALIKLNSFAAENNMPAHELINSQGVSIINGQTILSAPLSLGQLEEIEKNLSIQIHRGLNSGPPISISKTNSPDIYLYSLLVPPGGKPPIGPPATLAAIIFCILLSLAVALFYQSRKYQKRSDEAVKVLQKMREGNLSARMPVSKRDELSLLVDAFNEMAGDLEKMVDQLRKADKTRRQLLQDLAHDLRTPLTSLRTFLETLESAGTKLKEDQRKEILQLSFSEIEYFGKLVEDLLFLAQITEPQYSLGTEVIDLRERIEDQMMVFRHRHPKIEMKLQTQGSHFELRGSSQLVDRLLRNAFENSVSFSKSILRVSLLEETDRFVIKLNDDGPGFSEQALIEFGHKKASRVLVQAEEGQRISVGIGSVIMKEISHLHGGDIKAENQISAGSVRGAIVSISIKKS